MTTQSGSGERFTGHGAEWRDSNLTADEARAVERVCREAMERFGYRPSTWP